MPLIHQSGDATQNDVNQDAVLQRTINAMLDSALDRDQRISGPAENDLLPSSISELLGLNLPRGQIVGPGSPGGKGPGSLWSPTQSTPPIPSPRPNDDQPSFGSPVDMSPLRTGRGSDVFSPSGSGSGYNGSSGYGGGGGCGGVSGVSGSGSHGYHSNVARAIRGSPSYRLNSVGSDCSSPTLEQALLLNCSMGSRSNSPADSDTSGVSSLDSGNLSDLMNSLNLNRGHSNYSAQQQGSHGCLSPTLQQELNTLTNLHALQTLSNNPALKCFQQQPHVQANILSSLLQSYQQQHTGNQQSASAPVSPASLDCKPWAGGGVSGSDVLSAISPLRTCVSPCASSFDSNELSVDQVALSNRYLRNAAANLCDAKSTWSGTLPPRIYENPSYSVKMFLGGIPWDINEVTLINAFKQFGPIRVDWPGKDQGVPPPKGYGYIIFECEKQVKALLQACTKSFSNEGKNWYYKISSKRMKAKDVQIIPWTTSDTNYVKYPSQRLEPERTVFVGALHGMLNAHGLAKIMDDLFGGVVYAGIDIDKYKYPTGAGRVTFDNHRSFIKAILTAFIEVKTAKFTKKIQVDPYLDDSPCSVCNVQQGPYFCRDMNCFRYFCNGCWDWLHSLDTTMHSHKRMSRDFKSAKLGGVILPPRILPPRILPRK